jgi:hypothetical protein
MEMVVSDTAMGQPQGQMEMVVTGIADKDRC